MPGLAGHPVHRPARRRRRQLRDSRPKTWSWQWVLNFCRAGGREWEVVPPTILRNSQERFCPTLNYVIKETESSHIIRFLLMRWTKVNFVQMLKLLWEYLSWIVNSLHLAAPTVSLSHTSAGWTRNISTCLYLYFTPILLLLLVKFSDNYGEETTIIIFKFTECFLLHYFS